MLLSKNPRLNRVRIFNAKIISLFLRDELCTISTFVFSQEAELPFKSEDYQYEKVTKIS